VFRISAFQRFLPLPLSFKMCEGLGVMPFPIFLICANRRNLTRKLTLWAALQAVYLAPLGCGYFF
jgi:hypothetical protein